MPRSPSGRSFPFDARSVMLFAAIAVGGVTAQAQSPTPTSSARLATSSSTSSSSAPRAALGGATLAETTRADRSARTGGRQR